MSRNPFELAVNFSSLLRKKLTPTQFATVRRRNHVQESETICHSHDFCDANMVMAKAFKQVTGKKYNLKSGDDGQLWNDAWTIATDHILQ